MGFKCIICKKDFGTDQKALYKHLEKEHKNGKAISDLFVEPWKMLKENDLDLSLDDVEKVAKREIDKKINE